MKHKEKISTEIEHTYELNKADIITFVRTCWEHIPASARLHDIEIKLHDIDNYIDTVMESDSILEIKYTEKKPTQIIK